MQNENVMSQQKAISWFSAIGKKTFHITLTNYGKEDKAIFVNENAKIVSHWVEWSNIFVRPEPKHFVIRIGHGQCLANSIYFTQMQAVLKEIFNIKEKWGKDEGDKPVFRLQMSHEWSKGDISLDLLRELRNSANLYSKDGINFTLNLYIDILKIEAEGMDYKTLREFLKTNIKNNIYNIITLKNIQFAGEETKKLLNVLSGLLKNHLIMNIFLALHTSNINLTNPEPTDLVYFYKYMKNFCPKGFMEMIIGDFMDLNRAIKSPNLPKKLDLMIMDQIDDILVNGIIINALTGVITPMINHDNDDYKVTEGFSHSELKVLSPEEVIKKFKTQLVGKVVSSSCAKCPVFSTCIQQKIWWLNVDKNSSSCAIGLLDYIKKTDAR